MDAYTQAMMDEYTYVPKEATMTETTTTKSKGTEKDVPMYMKVTAKKICVAEKLPKGATTMWRPMKQPGVDTLLDFMEYFLLGDKTTTATKLRPRAKAILARVKAEGTETPQYVYIVEKLASGGTARLGSKSHLRKPLQSCMFE